jgi:hypothetical protein
MTKKSDKAEKDFELQNKYGEKKLLYAQALTIWNYRLQQKARAAGSVIPSWTAVHKDTPRYEEVMAIMRNGTQEELEEAKGNKPVRPPKPTPLPSEKPVAKKKPIALLKSFIKTIIPKLKEKVIEKKRETNIRKIVSAGKTATLEKLFKVLNLTTLKEKNDLLRKVARESKSEKVFVIDKDGKLYTYTPKKF